VFSKHKYPAVVVMVMQAINCEDETEYLESFILRGTGTAQSLHGLGYGLGELGFLLPIEPTDFSFNSDETGSGGLTTSYSMTSRSVTCSKSGRGGGGGWGLNLTTHFYLVLQECLELCVYSETLRDMVLSSAQGLFYIILDKTYLREVSCKSRRRMGGCK
jgi:hypothetical protein